jgi:NAD-dependent dihydropyrimidine dehydrogenase PreA subunit
VRRTRIFIDYGKCGDGRGIDPRECGRCLRACRPAVFLLHQTLGAKEENPLDPQVWRVTPLWPTLCTRCGACVEVCPQGAVSIKPPPAAGATGAETGRTEAGRA